MSGLRRPAQQNLRRVDPGERAEHRGYGAVGVEQRGAYHTGRHRRCGYDVELLP